MDTGAKEDPKRQQDERAKENVAHHGRNKKGIPHTIAGQKVRKAEYRGGQNG